jgi:hypothetical protein
VLDREPGEGELVEARPIALVEGDAPDAGETSEPESRVARQSMAAMPEGRCTPATLDGRVSPRVDVG